MSWVYIQRYYSLRSKLFGQFGSHLESMEAKTGSAPERPLWFVVGLEVNLPAIRDAFWIGWSFLTAVSSRPENRLFMMWAGTEITAPFLVCLRVRPVKMRPPGAPVINTTANDTWISWSVGSPLSVFIESFDFNIQVKEEKQHWRVSAPACMFTNAQDIKIQISSLLM